MTIVRVAKNEYGGHANQTADHFTALPDGWAILPDALRPDTFPFFNVEEVEDGVILAVSPIDPPEIPEPVIPDTGPSEVEQLRADVDYIALMMGVDL